METTRIDWMVLAESYREFFQIAGTGVLTLLGTMLVIHYQAKRQDKRLQAQREEMEIRLRAEHESQKREKQLNAVAEVSALLQSAFEGGYNYLLTALDPVAIHADGASLSHQLARHVVLLPPALEALANTSYIRSREFVQAVTLFGIAQHPKDQAAAFLVIAKAEDDPGMRNFRTRAETALQEFQGAASAFVNDTRLELRAAAN